MARQVKAQRQRRARQEPAPVRAGYYDAVIRAAKAAARRQERKEGGRT
jgi:hypothetical protein